jgi:hypothetical protein
MRIWGTLFLICTICAGTVSYADTTEQLLERAKVASVDRQAPLYIKAAEQELKTLNGLYDEGKVEEAQNVIKNIVTYSDQACDSAQKSRKHVKETEIHLRKMAQRLRDLKRGLNFEDQAPVQSATDHLENLRTDLLAVMFSKEKK